MCGIMGMVLGKRHRTEGELETLRLDFLDLLVSTESRGRDAVGAFVLNPTGVRFHKTAGSASDAVWQDGKLWGLMDQVTNETTAVIGHTRLATLGCPSCNDTNHPLSSRTLIGVHNGMIRNHAELRDLYPYDAEVDSGAIFSMLSAKAVDPLTTGTLVQALPELSGSIAIAVADRRKTGSVFIARNNTTSPLVTRVDTKRDILWIASTVTIMNEGLNEVRATHHVADNVVAELTRDNAEGKPIKYIPWTPKKETPRFSLISRTKKPYWKDQWQTFVGGKRIR